MKFNFRKIASAAASTLMLGSTVALAAAANYPAPFVTEGKADVAVVHGANAAQTDLVAATSIGTSLQSFVTTTGTGTIEGDSVLLAKSSDNLNLGDALNGPFGTTVDDEDLELLADGVYTADDSDTFDFEQKVTLGSPELAHFRDSDYESLVGLSESTPVIGINISNGQFLLNYTIDFLDDAESDVVGGDLDDLEGSFLPMFGKEFYISDWKNGTVQGETGKITLLDAAGKGLVREGETVNLIVDGVSYDVKIDYIDSDSAALSVNGEITDDLSEGQTEKLSDGTYVGITDVRKLEVSGELGTVEFSLGRGKLELEHKAEIQLNDDTVSDVRAYLYKGTPSGGAAKIDKIAIEWKADEELFVTPESEISLPGLGGLKFSMTEFVRGEEDKIVIQNDGDDSVELRVPVKDGTASINLVFSNATDGIIGLGEATDKRFASSPIGRLTFWEKKNNLDYHQYFVATYNDSDSGESYLLELRPREDTGNNRNETDVYNVVTGQFEATDKVANDQITIGDVSFTIETIFVNATDEYVNITAGTNTNFNTIYSVGGLRVYLPYNVANYTGHAVGVTEQDNYELHGLYPQQSGTAIGAINLSLKDDDADAVPGGHSNTTWHLTMDGEDKDDNIASGSAFEVRVTERLSSATATELYVDQVNTTGTFSGTGGVHGKEIANTNTYEAYVYDDVAPKVVHYTDPDQDWAEVYYPTGESQTYAMVYLASSKAATTSKTSIIPIKDSEVSSVSGVNFIVVGGACINTMAASLLGSDVPLCESDWEAATGVGSGEFLIQTFNAPGSSTKVATLVAGYNAVDTTNAATYLRTQPVDTTVGKKYVGTSATSAQLV